MHNRIRAQIYWDFMDDAYNQPYKPLSSPIGHSPFPGGVFESGGGAHGDWSELVVLAGWALPRRDVGSLLRPPSPPPFFPSPSCR